MPYNDTTSNISALSLHCYQPASARSARACVAFTCHSSIHAAALRAEDRERLDLHPLYLALGPDAESRYRAYMGLVAEDAAREPVPLVGRYFVGSRRFVGRMAKKFGLAGPGSRVEWEEHGPALVSLRPKHGGPSEPD